MHRMKVLCWDKQPKWWLNCVVFALTAQSQSELTGTAIHYFPYSLCCDKFVLNLSTLIIHIKYLKCLKNAENLCAEWRYFAETRNPSDGWTVSSLHWLPKPSLSWPALLSITFLTPSAVINLSAEFNNEKVGLIWFGVISAAFVCVMFHWSSFLHFRVRLLDFHTQQP